MSPLRDPLRSMTDRFDVQLSLAPEVDDCVLSSNIHSTFRSHWFSETMSNRQKEKQRNRNVFINAVESRVKQNSVTIFVQAHRQ